jgi:hypothetical protein
MILSTQEIASIGLQLDQFHIKYQEIYDELNDHMISAIEDLRSNGDQRNIVVLFMEVVQTQFPGNQSFLLIASQYEKAYQKKIRSALWAAFRDSINWITIPFLVSMIIWGFYLPYGSVTTLSLTLAVALLAMIPHWYIAYSTRQIRAWEGKESLGKRYLKQCTGFMCQLSTYLFGIINLLCRNWAFLHLPDLERFAPILFMPLLGFYFIYGLGCVRLMASVRQPSPR